MCCPVQQCLVLENEENYSACVESSSSCVPSQVLPIPGGPASDFVYLLLNVSLIGLSSFFPLIHQIFDFYNGLSLNHFGLGGKNPTFSLSEIRSFSIC